KGTFIFFALRSAPWSFGRRAKKMNVPFFLISQRSPSPTVESPGGFLFRGRLDGRTRNPAGISRSNSSSGPAAAGPVAGRTAETPPRPAGATRGHVPHGSAGVFRLSPAREHEPAGRSTGFPDSPGQSPRHPLPSPSKSGPRRSL